MLCSAVEVRSSLGRLQPKPLHSILGASKRPWRNWIARRSSEPRVAGSNPAGRTDDALWQRGSGTGLISRTTSKAIAGSRLQYVILPERSLGSNNSC